MATIEEQIQSLEEEIGKTKYNKSTQGHIGKLKAKIAALKARKEKAQAHAKSSGGGPGFEVKKSGDASVALVGFGTFSVSHRAARMGRNPATGEAIHINASNVPKFKAGKALKDACN